MSSTFLHFFITNSEQKIFNIYGSIDIFIT
jgi:hypothetical protein